MKAKKITQCSIHNCWSPEEAVGVVFVALKTFDVDVVVVDSVVLLMLSQFPLWKLLMSIL